MARIRSRPNQQPLAYEPVEIRPQAGPQELFLSSPADIVIYGGAAGGGKTWGLLYEPLRHILPSTRFPNGVPGFSGVIFRRTSPQIRNEGGLWDESLKIYSQFGARPKETILEHVFPYGQTMRFAAMQHESDKLNWQGSQIPYIGFDELTHFTEGQFFYMMSRSRSVIGIKPYIRATTNPDVDSWVADFISWWIDQDEHSPNYGLPIPERAGVLRYFIRQHGQIHWADDPEELYKYLPKNLPVESLSSLVKSITFIPASVYDNKILLQENPEYLGNLLALPLVERERLLGMSWKVRPQAGKLFNRTWWAKKIVQAVPAEAKRVRAWDKAGTDEIETSGVTPYTAGVKVSRAGDNYYVEDVQRERLSSLKRERLIQNTAVNDGPDVMILIEQEPGSGGKESAENSVRGLAGYNVRIRRVTGDKVSRAMPASAQVEAGNVYLLEGEWNKDFIEELHNFPDGLLKDQVDGFSLAFNKLAKHKVYDVDEWPTSSK